MKWVVRTYRTGVELRIPKEDVVELADGVCPYPWGNGIAVLDPDMGTPVAYYNSDEVIEIRQLELPYGGRFHYRLKRLDGSHEDVFTEDRDGLIPYRWGLGKSQENYTTEFVTVTVPPLPSSKFRRLLLIAKLREIRSLVRMDSLDR